MRTDSLLRAEVTGKIHRSALPDPVWRRAQQWSGYSDVMEGRKPIGLFVEYVSGLLGMFEEGQVWFSDRRSEHLPRDKNQRQRPTADLRLERQRALALHAAAVAERDGNVVRFRHQHLGGQTLNPEDVQPWIERMAAEDGESAIVLLAEASRGTRLRETEAGIVPIPAVVVDEAHPAFDRTFKILRYALTDETGAGNVAGGIVAVATGGALDELRQLDERMGATYGWPDGDGALFVLTGAIPVLKDISSDIEVCTPPAFSRILLRIDLTSTPEQVADEYKRLRHRNRTPSLKFLRLAGWLSDRPPDEPNSVRMDAWNHQCLEWGKAAEPDDWHYESPSNFSRDCRDACNRLLNPI